MSYIGGDDLVFYSDKDKNIYSGGFSVNSIMMKGGFSPFSTLNNETSGTIQTGGNVSDLFKDLVVPSWLLTQSNKLVGGAKNNKADGNEEDNDSENEGVISDDLHDKLLELATISDNDIKNNKKKTRRFKNNKNKNKGTKKK